MERRSFLKTLGLAVAGAAVASKIELLEQVIPIPASPLEAVIASYDAAPLSASPITFSMLEKAYRRACVGSYEPNLLVVSKSHYSQILSMMEPQYRFSDRKMEDEFGFNAFKFHNAYTNYGILEEPARPELIQYGFRQDLEAPVLVGISKEVINASPRNKSFYANFI